MTPGRPLAVAFLGNDAWSVAPLEAIASSHHPISVVATRVPRPRRRGAGLAPTPVADAARRLGLHVAEVETVGSGPGLGTLVAAAPDVLVVVAYGELLGRAVLELPAVAPVNLHFSLLPALRGASPVQTALLLGLGETGVSTIVMDEGLDTGDVLLRRPARIEREDDAGSLGGRLARIGGDVLVETLDRLASGTIERHPQDEASATYAPKLDAAARRLEWTRTADELENVVRAMAPEPGATTTFRGAPLKITRAYAVAGSGPPGEIVVVERDGFTVATGRAAVRIAELAPAGRARMPASSFVNGFRPHVGERVGEPNR
jgi:methionyl-tRNA formyltransferase